MREGMTNKKGGSKLNRCAPISVRFDPKIKHAADMAARYQRRTLSSYIEWAVEFALTNSDTKDLSGQAINLWEVAEKTFDVDDSEKLIRMALNAPNLLNYDEMQLWKVIETHPYFWRNHDAYMNRISGYTDKDLDLGKIRKQWANILKYVENGQDCIPDSDDDKKTLEEIAASAKKRLKTTAKESKTT